MKSNQSRNPFADLGIDLESCGDDFVELDLICDRFETDWKRTFCLEDLLILADGVNLDKRGRLLQELALSDQELRWRDWSEQELLRFEQGIPLTHHQTGLFRVADYVAGLSIPDFADELETQEWECRCKYGDLPLVAGSSSKKREQDDIPAATIEVIQEGNVRLQHKFRGQLQIGRQRHGDPFPFAPSSGHSNKLIIAERGDPRISRNQIRIVFHTDKLVLIHNPSRKRAFVVQSAESPLARSVVSPGDEICFRVPATINLKTLMLRVDR